MKITLENLHEASPQQVFDQVATHLLTQGVKSQRDPQPNMVNPCMYRGDGGLQCAAGCLISDDEYRSDLEFHSWIQLVARWKVPDAHQDLIEELQGVHDTWDPKEWRYHLAQVASNYRLNTLVLEEFR